MKYGEILFLGGCNLNCYYCLQHEMRKLKKEQENQLNIHFNKWNNFEKFIEICKKEKINKIFLSSTSSEPTLYVYLQELIIKLKKEGFKVGLRSNGYFAIENIDAILECDEEISFSVNSLKSKTNYKICGVEKIPDWDKLLSIISNNKKSCRISVVVNRFNVNEITQILDFFNKYTCIEYIQLRKVYKYKHRKLLEDLAFNKIKKWVIKNCKLIGNYFESPIYQYNNIKISLWETVFKKESISSINYFTNGLLSNSTLLIPAYENKEGEINE